MEALLRDRRWPLGGAGLDGEGPPFGKASLVRFRTALIGRGLDRRRIERPLAVAERAGGFSRRTWRAALDSSPLGGVGRVEETDNLLGHALRKAGSVLARQPGRGLAQGATEAGADWIAGASLKAALALDWDEPSARQRALALGLSTVDAVARWGMEHAAGGVLPAVSARVEATRQGQTQDVESTEDGQPMVRRGVARDRQLWLADPEMRHGRQSRRQRLDGDTRQVGRTWTRGWCAVGGTPANAPEAAVTTAMTADLAPQGVTLLARPIERGYLSRPLVRERPAGLAISWRAWPVRHGGRFLTPVLALKGEAGTMRGPNQMTRPCHVGGVMHVPAQVCAACPLRTPCTRSAHGRSVAIYPDERLLRERRERQPSAEGRANLRARVAGEHALAHVGRWPGRRARYRGVRKNLFALRRAAVVDNLQAMARLSTATDNAA
jgi:hypothetical protein